MIKFQKLFVTVIMVSFFVAVAMTLVYFSESKIANGSGSVVGGEKITDYNQVELSEKVEENVDPRTQTRTEENVSDDSANEAGGQSEKTQSDDVESSTSSENDYVHSYTATAVTFTPDSDNYIGYSVCEKSSCTVYGIENSKIAKAVLGGTYRISFNKYGDCKAALGTTYCVVSGNVEIVPV